MIQRYHATCLGQGVGPSFLQVVSVIPPCAEHFELRTRTVGPGPYNTQESQLSKSSLLHFAGEKTKTCPSVSHRQKSLLGQHRPLPPKRVPAPKNVVRVRGQPREEGEAARPRLGSERAPCSSALRSLGPQQLRTAQCAHVFFIRPHRAARSLL